MGSLTALRRDGTATVVLVYAFLAALLLALLTILDLVFTLHAYPGGLLVLFPLAFLFLLLQWYLGPAAVRRSLGDKIPVNPKTNPWLHGVVEETVRQAAVPMPQVWVVEDPNPNAFVFGRSLASSELVVTRGLLETLNQDEIRAVIAHEVGHLRHRDVILMTWVSAVPLLSYLVARVGFEVLRASGKGRSSKGKGQVLLVAFLIAAVSYTIYLVSQLLVRYLSRTREYYADAYSAAATRDPHLLASALTKISFGLSLVRNRAEPTGLRAFYIGDPVKAANDYHNLREKMAKYDIDRDGQLDRFELDKAVKDERRFSWGRANHLFATHPSTYDRILMLEEFEEEIVKGNLPANIYAFI